MKRSHFGFRGECDGSRSVSCWDLTFTALTHSSTVVSCVLNLSSGGVQRFDRGELWLAQGRDVPQVSGSHGLPRAGFGGRPGLVALVPVFWALGAAFVAFSHSWGGAEW